MFHTLAPIVLMMSAEAANPAGACQATLASTAMAITPWRLDDDGRAVVEIDYSTEAPGTRVIEVPAVIRELRGRANLRVVVLAGNSGDEYEHTRHSLAFAFGDYLARHWPARFSRAGAPVVSRERVAVTYDDGSARGWDHEFRTEVPFARTGSGEVIPYPESDLVVVQMIGDYNEVGDLAIPILDALGMPARRLILVHDDLSRPEGTVGVVTEVQKYNGNNAQFSLIRSLAYGAWPRVRAVLGGHAELDDARWAALETEFRQKADVRYANHLGQPRAFASAFKNVDAVVAGFAATIAAVETAVNAPLNDRLAEVQAELSKTKRPLGPVATELAKVDLDGARRAGLLAERDRLNAAAKPLADEVKRLRAEVDQTKKRLTAHVREVVVDRLTFSRLSIGTDDGRIDRGDLPGFVLGPYPRDVFTDEVWGVVAEHLRAWARENR